MDSAVAFVKSSNCSSISTTPVTTTSYYSSSDDDKIPDIPASLMIPPLQTSMTPVIVSSTIGRQTIPRTFPVSSVGM